MTSLRATVFGGSGFLGRHIVQQLLQAQHQVVVACRRPQLFRRHSSGSVAVAADVRDVTAVRTAVQGASVVINAVGLYAESSGATFEDVHVAGARNVATEAARVGARVVHISGIGVDPQSDSPYVRARASGERQVVSESAPNCAILRPSVLFGPNDRLLQTLEGITRLPVVPLFGHGTTAMQPVHVNDVAEAVARLAQTALSQATVYELGGPDVIRYRELLRLVCTHLQRTRLLLPVPFAAWDLLARALSLGSNPSLTRDQVILMRSDNTVANGALTFSDLELQPRSLADELVQCLPRAAKP